MEGSEDKQSWWKGRKKNEILRRIIAKGCEKRSFQKVLVRVHLETDSYDDLGKESLFISSGSIREALYFISMLFLFYFFILSLYLFHFIYNLASSCLQIWPFSVPEVSIWFTLLPLACFWLISVYKYSTFQSHRIPLTLLRPHQFSLSPTPWPPVHISLTVFSPHGYSFEHGGQGWTSNIKFDRKEYSAS